MLPQDIVEYDESKAYQPFQGEVTYDHKPVFEQLHLSLHSECFDT